MDERTVFWVIYGVALLAFLAFMFVRTKQKVNSWEYRDILSMERGKYTLGLSIVKKDGTATKSIGFVIVPYMNPFDPHDAAKDLESHGIRCELPAGKGTIFGNRSK